MFSIYYKNKIKNVYNSLIQSKPCKEVLEANFYKLPENIQVEWFRDGKYIIGTISADGYEYKTQALSADEFIEMVNDTLYSVYEIPSNCINILNKKQRFLPNPEEFKQLNDNAIRRSDMNMVREKELVTA